MGVYKLKLKMLSIQKIDARQNSAWVGIGCAQILFASTEHETGRLWLGGFLCLSAQQSRLLNAKQFFGGFIIF